MSNLDGLGKIISISACAIALALFVIYILIGTNIIIPLLESLQADRLISGDTPSIWEASLVFLIVMLYMFVLTVGVVAGGLSGWIVIQARKSGGFSRERIKTLFQVGKP